MVQFGKLSFIISIRQWYAYDQNFHIKHRLYIACDLKLSAFIFLCVFYHKS